MSNNAPIGSPQQPFREMDLHFLMRALAGKQALTEHMMIAVRGDHWHLALSLIQRELGVEQPSRIRALVDFVVKSLYRSVPDGVDVGSTLVEDLPMPWGEKSDVVVSWADTEDELRKEVDSIRACLDALGLFHVEGQHRLQEVHAEHVSLGVGEVSVKLDRDKHLFSASGNFKVGRILSLLGHVIPGLGKTEIGGKINLRLPYKDSREKFIAALMALQWQSNDKLPTCSELHKFRQKLNKADLDPQELQEDWKDIVLPSQEFLKRSMAAIDRELRPAFSVHPSGKAKVYERTYDMALRAVQNRHFEDAIECVQDIQYPGPVIRRAMGENYYLFAANVIMQAQIGWFEQDLERTLKERFGLDLQRGPESPTPPPGDPPAGPSPGCDPQGSSPSNGPSRPRRPRP
jgi:hypothetical protein